MRAKAHTFEAVVIRLAVDGNEIRPDVAVAVTVASRRASHAPTNLRTSRCLSRAPVER